jgi:VWFA-related protein
MRVQFLVMWLALGTVVTMAQTGTPQPPAKPAAPQPQPPPQTQKPVFRTGIELLTVDATVVDRDGRQLTDLQMSEFVVEVDGDPRPVVSAEYIKLVDDTPVPIGTKRVVAPAPDETFFSTNTRSLVPGRLILLLVDEGNIRVGQGRDVMRGAVKFVDGLSPDDKVALAAIPRGALVDFTTNHERVREGLLATVGRASPYKGRFYMSLSEAIAAYEHSDAMLRNQLILRECAAVLGNPVEATRCEIEVEQEAGEFVHHERQQTQASLHGMREVLRSLAALEGPKSVILISEGLVLEGLGGEVDEIAAIAADVRASLDVMLLDVPSVDVSIAQRPSTPREDREKQVTGLEQLSGLARGGLHRVITSSDTAFTRIMRSIAGHYLIGVEARPADRDGRRHRISVKTNRRGATILSRRGFLAPMGAAASSPTEAVNRALRSPLTMNDVPMRIATWTYKDPGTPKVRLLVAAEIERTSDQKLEYTAGFVVVDRNGRGTATAVEPRTLRASESDPGVAVFAGSLLLDAGTYVLRFAASDSEGRLGSVERKVEAWQMNTAGLTVGDLLIGEAPESNVPLAPAIEPVVSNGQLAVMMEVYAAKLTTDTLQATLDIVAEENAKPLLSAAMKVGSGRSPEVGVLHGMMSTTALPPGRYLARASVKEDGKARGHLVRPFRVAAPSAAAASGTPANMPARLPAEMLVAMLANLPPVERKELVAPTVLATVLASAEKARPAAKGAFAAARSGNLGSAALDALASGDQVTAAFLRGIDLFGQGQTDRAVQQLQIAMQQAPSFAPTRMYLGAALAEGNRHREAAGLLQSAGAELATVAPVARMAANSWLRVGDAANAITALEQANASGDTAVSRTLALAYLTANRGSDALPLLARSLEANPRDQDTLLSAIYATYVTHFPTARQESLAADRTRAQTWAKAYGSLKGERQALVDLWMKYLTSIK